MSRTYDRAAEDVGNIVALEHVNLKVEDQGLATLFYISGLGLTRDPYMMTSIDNMWVNVGGSQFHLPTMARAQRLRGRVGLVIPDREALLQRLDRVKGMLEEHREKLEEITQLLLEQEVLEGEDLDRVLGNGDEVVAESPEKEDLPETGASPSEEPSPAAPRRGLAVDPEPA